MKKHYIEIPPPSTRKRFNPDCFVIFWIVFIWALGIATGYTIREIWVRADAEVAEQTIEQTVEMKQIASAPVIAQSVVMERTEPEPETEPYYALTEAERYEIEQVVMAEADGEPYDGQVSVAQCIRDAAIRDKLRPSEVIVEYKYTPDRKEPTQSVQEAVRAVFDDGESVIDTAYYFYAPALVQSKWHEAQEFVAELGGHRFFR